MARSVTMMNGEEIILSDLEDDSKVVHLLERLQAEKPLPSRVQFYKISSDTRLLQDHDEIGPQMQFTAVIEMRQLNFWITWQQEYTACNWREHMREVQLSVVPEPEDQPVVKEEISQPDVEGSDRLEARDTHSDDEVHVEEHWFCDEPIEPARRLCEIGGPDILHKLRGFFGASVPGLCDSTHEEQLSYAELSHEEQLREGGFAWGEDFLGNSESDEENLRLLREMLEMTDSGSFFDATDHYRNSVKGLRDEDLEFRVAGHIIICSSQVQDIEDDSDSDF